jgi:predicted RNA-binding protein with PUA-like domain
MDYGEASDVSSVEEVPVKKTKKASTKEPKAEAKGKAKASPSKKKPAAIPVSAGYYLMKAEAESRMHNGKDVRFSIDDFEAIQTSAWDGVRNFVARNHMRSMKLGDKVLFYHSNCKVPGVAGLAEVSKEAFPDPSAFDKSHAYYDPKSSEDDPKWFCVEVKSVKKFADLVTLKEMKEMHTKPGNPLADMSLFKPGRLSVQPVKVSWRWI